MKKVLFVFCAFALVTLSGCGSSPDSVMKDSIKTMNDLAEAIEKKDEAKAKAAAKKLEELQKKGEELEKKMSADDKKKLEEKYKGDAEKALMRLFKAIGENQEFVKKLDLPKTKQ